MKTFINKIFIFVGILAVLILIIAMLPIEQDNYLQAYNKKMQIIRNNAFPPNHIRRWKQFKLWIGQPTNKRLTRHQCD